MSRSGTFQVSDSGSGGPGNATSNRHKQDSLTRNWLHDDYAPINHKLLEPRAAGSAATRVQQKRAEATKTMAQFDRSFSSGSDRT
ncbi:hypothetical protein VP1G_11397 [Cytospora mali]|uniref:Uncharacterized protein n=1 Tax=Cytospora mali TaxID=578113 RepID=A0A194VF80_CYTMA|nr:hypothetical protein VP1G_11397 [Valsa mali var. pyri (nom. inval.)]